LPHALLAQVTDRQPRAVRAHGNTQHEPAGVGDLLDAFSVGADAIDLSGFSAGKEAAVRVRRNALGVIESFAEDAGTFERKWHVVISVVFSRNREATLG